MTDNLIYKFDKIFQSYYEEGKGTKWLIKKLNQLGIVRVKLSESSTVYCNQYPEDHRQYVYSDGRISLYSQASFNEYQISEPSFVIHLCVTGQSDFNEINLNKQSTNVSDGLNLKKCIMDAAKKIDNVSKKIDNVSRPLGRSARLRVIVDIGYLHKKKYRKRIIKCLEDIRDLMISNDITFLV